MFDTILIANRGEIACRIMRTARAMGVRTVAVYSDADADAVHVRMADHAVRLGPAPVADSYLRGDLVIAAALETGAEAIHPGYGFLSENPDFVDDVVAAGVTFVGPSADAIRAMGLKDAAKDLMSKAGVPVVPGYQGADQSAAHLAAEAEQVGYPVLIKAVAGGGGKGMRLVEGAADFAQALASAQAEAKTAFGNGHVLIEKFIVNPRHIEMQVFGDGRDAVHLFERDCSLQRRHQKVIEEAPAPGMTDDVRDAMGAAAVTAAKAIGYAGAGTVEFIVDGSRALRTDGFWFMEMNTRLQVEHPVTEAITGVDLVEWQLRVASGEALPARQGDLSITGHAFEARLYAEDVPRGFLPATGRITHLAFPSAARIDSGVAAGSDISPWYDPMIAKVTVHGADRAGALRTLGEALDDVEVAGLVTNLGFLQRLSRHPAFVAGGVDTGLIVREVGLVEPVDQVGWRLAWAAVVAAGLDQPAGALQGFSLWSPLRQTVTLAVGDEVYPVVLSFVGSGRVEADISGETYQVDLAGFVDGRRCPRGLRHGDQVTLFGADPVVYDVPDPLARGGDAAGGDAVLAPMPGLVQAVEVVAGDAVAEGQRMVVMEAMKMEHTLRAPRDGVVGEVTVAVGDQVSAGMALVTLEIAT